MKITKKISRSLLTAFIVILAVFTLTGCTTKSERAQKSAEKAIDKGKYELAVEELTEVIDNAREDKPNDISLMIDAYYIRGDCYSKMGMTKEAQADYEAGVAADDAHPDAGRTSTTYLRRGMACVSIGDYEAALEAFQKGLAMDEVACEQELLRGEIICAERIGDWDTALSEAEKYINKFPDDLDMVKEYNFLITRQQSGTTEPEETEQ